jgi:hypothetical protein
MSGDLTPGGSLLAYLHEQPPIPPITAAEAAAAAGHVRRYANGDSAIECELLDTLGLGGAA